VSGVLALVRLDLRRRLRDPLAAVTWLALPVAMVALLVAAFGPGRAPRAVVGVVDHDGGLAARALVQGLGSERLRGLVEVRPQEPASAGGAMRRGELAAVLEIPAGFTDGLLEGRPVSLTLRTNPQQEVLPRIATGVVETLAEGLGLLRVAADPVIRRLWPEGGTREPTLEDSQAVGALMYELFRRPEARALLDPDTISVTVSATRPRYTRAQVVGWFVPGFLVMGLLFLAVGLTDAVHQEARRGQLARLFTMPCRPATVAAAKVAAVAIWVTVCGLLMAAVFAAVLGWRPAHPVLLAVAVGAASAALAALGLALRGLARSPEGAGAASTGIMVGLAFLGGVFVPSQLLPAGLARAADLVPPGWAVTAVRLAQEAAPAGAGFWWRIGALGASAAAAGWLSGRLLLRRVRTP